MTLATPPLDFDTIGLKVKEVSPRKLKRISRHDSGEPYFGRWASSRFDSPDKKFGTCYCGQTLAATIAETILHDEIPVGGAFRIREEEFEKRFLVTYDGGHPLRLADLTGASLKRLGGDNNLSAETPYTVTQQWGAAVHGHPERVDGLLFVSKNLNDQQVVVVFDRARRKMGRPAYTPLSQAKGLAAAKRRLGIQIIKA